MERKLLWITRNGIMALALYLGVFKSIAWAGNILLFIVWFFTLPLYIFAACNNQMREELRSKGRTVPKWASCSLAAVFILGLVAAGWFFTAVAYALILLCEQAVYSDINMGGEKS